MKNNETKLLSLALVAVLVFTLFAGCSSQSAQQNGTPNSTQSSNGQTDSEHPDTGTPTEPTPETVQTPETEANTETASVQEPTAPDPAETATPTEASTEPEPGLPDNSAHVYPEDPWGLVHSMKLEYTTREDEKRCVVFPYLYTEDYLEEENMHIQYSVLDMDERLADMASKVARAEASEIYPSKSGFEYEVHAWEDILVIAAKYWDSIEEDVYQIYLVDTSDPYLRQLSTAELLERMGISEEYFLETCRRQCLERFHERWDSMASLYGEDYQSALREAEKGEYVNLELQAYPDESGRLYVIVPLISIVGASSYYGILELEMPGSN